MNIYSNIISRAEGLATIQRNGSNALWVKRVLRKSRSCDNCGQYIGVGQEAYGPMSDKQYRYERLCVPCVEG